MIIKLDRQICFFPNQAAEIGGTFLCHQLGLKWIQLHQTCLLEGTRSGSSSEFEKKTWWNDMAYAFEIILRSNGHIWLKIIYVYIYNIWKYSFGFTMKLQLATSSHLIHLHTCTALKLNYSKIEMIAPAFQTWNGLERVLVFRIWAGFQHAYLKMLSKKGRNNPRPYGGWP